LLACFVKNLAEAIADYEIFPRLQGHRDNLQQIRILAPLPIGIIVCYAIQNSAGVAVGQHFNPGFPFVSERK
jgi:hypothetical protein